MSRHVLAPTSDVLPGERKLFIVKGRPIAVFNLGGEYFGLFNRCPHQGGSLCDGIITGLVKSDQPGRYTYEREGEILRCPWHGWEFDIRTGKSQCDAERIKTRAFPVNSVIGTELAEQSLVAETIKVQVQSEYIVVEM